MSSCHFQDKALHSGRLVAFLVRTVARMEAAQQTQVKLIMENTMGTTIVYRGYIGIVENKMETTIVIVYWGQKTVCSPWPVSLPADMARGTFLRAPRKRITLFWGLYRGPLILGNYQLISSCSS